MNPIQNRSRESFYPLQVAGTIRSTSVAAVEPSPNVVSQIISSGAPKPHATVSNDMVALVDSYTPPPGRNMAHYLAMDVDKAGQENTTVADALQRYLNVSPTRKPGGDPKDLDSRDSYPTLILDEDKAWTDILPYKFSVNGIPQQQTQPTFFARGGSLKIRVVGRGVSSVATPPTEPAEPIQAGPQATGAYYPPEVAAQLAMRRLTDMFDPSRAMPVQAVGPDLARNPVETLASVAETLSGMNAVLAGPRVSESVREGLNRFANMGIYKKSPQLRLGVLASNA
jgi:hypothetical protein